MDVFVKLSGTILMFVQRHSILAYTALEQEGPLQRYFYDDPHERDHTARPFNAMFTLLQVCALSSTFHRLAFVLIRR
jgi:hypothetical protein